MFNTRLIRGDREFILRRSRLPISLVSAAVLGISLLVSVAPALGAAANSHDPSSGNGSGNVKVHDASTGEEGLGSDNEPHVCAFWLEFTMPAPYENGAWTLVSWPPTGDGSTVAAGAYDTSGDGTDASSVIDVAAGHYRVEWAATGETVTKKKTFWVDASCDASSPSGGESTPEAPAGSADESPVESSSIGESPDESPVESAIESPATESPAEAVVSPAEESVREDAPTDDASPADASPADASPADASPADESPAESGDQEVLSGSGSGSGDESTAEEPVGPSDDPADEPADQPAGPVASDPGDPPAQDQLGGHGVSGASDMADTASATHPVPTGLPATLGLLFLVVLQASLRRTRRPEVA
jgi:hypothetical protein